MTKFSIFLENIEKFQYKKIEKKTKTTGLVGIMTWDMQCNLLLRIGRCLVPVSGFREREREREREKIKCILRCSLQIGKLIKFFE
jgi:hypothetical protein